MQHHAALLSTCLLMMKLFGSDSVSAESAAGGLEQLAAIVTSAQRVARPAYSLDPIWHGHAILSNSSARNKQPHQSCLWPRLQLQRSRSSRRQLGKSSLHVVYCRHTVPPKQWNSTSQARAKRDRDSPFQHNLRHRRIPYMRVVNGVRSRCAVQWSQQTAFGSHHR